MAAFERMLERKRLVAAAVAGKRPTAEVYEASGLRELIAGLELSFTHFNPQH
jgi:hypothetical protein